MCNLLFLNEPRKCLSVLDTGRGSQDRPRTAVQQTVWAHWGIIHALHRLRLFQYFVHDAGSLNLVSQMTLQRPQHTCNASQFQTWLARNER